LKWLLRRTGIRHQSRVAVDRPTEVVTLHARVCRATDVGAKLRVARGADALIREAFDVADREEQPRPAVAVSDHSMCWL